MARCEPRCSIHRMDFHMKFAIADPPYLGRAAIWYGETMRHSQKGQAHGGSASVGFKPADYHENAHEWDNIETHKNLIDMLEKKYDGFALAMAHDNLQKLIPYFRPNIKIMIWNKWSVPSRARVQNRYEPVAIRIPKNRKGAVKGQTMTDVLIHKTRPAQGFTGAKPMFWTYWVLEALGVKKGDVVEDLFNGSGMVNDAINNYMSRL